MMDKSLDNRDTLLPTDVFKTEEITPEVIQHVVKRIVECVRPEKIILFGSVARNQFDPERSDLDILVVMDTDQPKYRRSHIVSDLVRPRFFDMDIIIYTPEEFNTAASHEDPWFDPFIKEVLEDGITLYDREAH